MSKTPELNHDTAAELRVFRNVNEFRAHADKYGYAEQIIHFCADRGYFGWFVYRLPTHNPRPVLAEETLDAAIWPAKVLTTVFECNGREYANHFFIEKGDSRDG
jgi:hypothetical protein